jgi:DNA-binding LacI/PurR family transcriptional regulator
LVRLKTRPDAVFCCNELTAIGAMLAALHTMCVSRKSNWDGDVRDAV